MKIIILLLHCIICFSIFSNKNIENKILFDYENEYMQYSYLNSRSCLGCLKQSAELKHLLFNDIPYDGTRIIVTENKQIIYLNTKNPIMNIKNKSKTIKYNEYFNNQFTKDFSIGDQGDLKFEKNKTLRLKEEKQFDFDINIDGEKVMLKDAKYVEISVSDELYNKLLKKIRVLNEKTNEYFNNQTRYIPTRVEIELYEVKLGYVTQIKTFENKIIFFDEDIELLKEKKNEIYFLSEEIKKEIENYLKTTLN